jgi:hypothetical protein
MQKQLRDMAFSKTCLALQYYKWEHLAFTWSLLNFGATVLILPIQPFLLV